MLQFSPPGFPRSHELTLDTRHRRKYFRCCAFKDQRVCSLYRSIARMNISYLASFVAARENLKNAKEHNKAQVTRASSPEPLRSEPLAIRRKGFLKAKTFFLLLLQHCCSHISPAHNYYQVHGWSQDRLQCHTLELWSGRK